MRKWILLVVLVGGCSRGPRPGDTLAGAAAPRLAVQQFLAAVQAQDLQAMALVWGTAKGPARDQLERTELEKREIIMQACYEHERYQILDEGPAPDGERAVRVEIVRGPLRATPVFAVVRGPSGRWFVRDANIVAVKDFCKRD